MTDKPVRGPFAVREVTVLDSAAHAAVLQIDDAVRNAYGAAALDEAGQRHLDHRGLAEARLWVSEDVPPDGEGLPTGFALVRRSGEAHDLTLAVTPSRRSHSAGSALAQASLHGLAGRIVAWSHADDPAARRLAEAHDFERVRELLVMERTASDLPAVPHRDDVEIRGFDPDAAEDERAVLAVNAAAFAHHPEQGAMDARDFAERTSTDWFEPAGLLLARDVATSEVLGFHWTKLTERDGRAVGEVYVVGIAPAAQGRGLGKLLTAAGLRHLAGRGAEVIELYVEGDNAPARAVYEGLGFAIASTHVQYARD